MSGFLKVFLVLAIPAVILQAQISAPVTQEKKPEPKDPRYVPPALPDRLLPQGPQLFFSTSGELDASRALEALDRQKARQEKNNTKNKAREFYNASENRSVYEDSVLRQFGFDQLKYRDQSEKYKETPSRRFQIVYFLSLPFTAALAGGLYSLSLQARGDVRSLNFYEALGALAAGGLISGGIAYHDYRRQWHTSQAGEKAFREAAWLYARDENVFRAGIILYR